MARKPLPPVTVVIDHPMSQAQRERLYDWWGQMATRKVIAEWRAEQAALAAAAAESTAQVEAK